MKLKITMLVYLNTYISIIQYIFVKYYLTFVVLISSEDLVTNISPTYNLHTEFLFLKFKYYLLIFLLKCKSLCIDSINVNSLIVSRHCLS